GAKAPTLCFRSCGTTEVVPFPRSLVETGPAASLPGLFSASSEVVPLSPHIPSPVRCHRHAGVRVGFEMGMLRIYFQSARYGCDPHTARARPTQDSRTFGNGCAGGENVVHQQNLASRYFLRTLH